jgi:hypothetical protein
MIIDFALVAATFQRFLTFSGFFVPSPDVSELPPTSTEKGSYYIRDITKYQRKKERLPCTGSLFIVINQRTNDKRNAELCIKWTTMAKIDRDGNNSIAYSTKLDHSITAELRN